MDNKVSTCVIWLSALSMVVMRWLMSGAALCALDAVMQPCKHRT